MTHEHADGDEHLQFLVWCLSFFIGMRLTTTEAGFLDATPIQPGELTDFTPLTRQLTNALTLADQFWKQHSSNMRTTKRVSGIIHALFLSQYPQALCFE